MLKRLIIAIFIDIGLIVLWDYWANSIHVEQEAAIGVIFIVPALIIVSGVVGLFLKFKNKVWGNVILVNVIIAFAIFFGVFKYEGWKQQHDRYLEFYFTDNGKIYNITLNLNKAQLQNGLTYNVYEILGEYGNFGTDLDGTYTKNNDTIILISDKGKVMKIHRKTLLDYPKKGDITALRDSPN